MSEYLVLAASVAGIAYGLYGATSKPSNLHIGITVASMMVMNVAVYEIMKQHEQKQNPIILQS